MRTGNSSAENFSNFPNCAQLKKEIVEDGDVFVSLGPNNGVWHGVGAQNVMAE